ncbi:MAG: addiction module protein [Bacteroidota bacterium]|nr:addiction module protein [Bacteroidota bacterium]
MNLQYISDNNVKTTGVFIPINDWKYLKNKYKEIEQEERDTFEVPEWQKEIVRQRLKDYQDNPDKVLDWDNIQREIEEKYGF